MREIYEKAKALGNQLQLRHGNEVRVVVDDGRSVLRVAASDLLEVRFRHVHARHRVAVVRFMPTISLDTLEEMYWAAVGEILRMPPLMMYADKWPADANDKDGSGEWIVWSCVERVDGAQWVTRSSVPSREMAFRAYVILLEAALSLELAQDYDRCAIPEVLKEGDFEADLAEVKPAQPAAEEEN